MKNSIYAFSSLKQQTARVLTLALILFSACSPLAKKTEDTVFNGERALADVNQQIEFGPRIPGSDAHQQTVTYISDSLAAANWEVEIRETTLLDKPIRNVIGKRGEGDSWIIIGAHYDSRIFADHDPDPAKRNKPVPGANDGASGVAVLLELARIIPDEIEGEIWLVFFDAEDNGRIPGWDWIMGSTAFAQALVSYPEMVIIVDMIGDKDLNIYQERSSNQALTSELWQIAGDLGYIDTFIPEVKHSILDDHTPFLALGIPAVDIIDFDYAYYHTTEDTPDKVSAESSKNCWGYPSYISDQTNS